MKDNEDLKKEETKEIAGFKNEILILKKKNIKYKIFIWLLVFLYIFTILGILYNSINNQIIQSKESIIEKVVKIDLNEFKESWNKKVYKIKYDNSFTNIKFNIYELDKEIVKQLNRYLYINKDRSLQLKKELKSSDNISIYTPVLFWIDKNLELTNIKDFNITNSNQLMKKVANSISYTESFSDKTIDTIIQLNEFCYYFEKNKNDFYRDGYSKNIKYCKDILNTIENDKKIKNKNLISIKQKNI